MSQLMAIMIERACRETRPQTTERMKALATVRWVLASKDGRFVTVNESAKASLTTSADEATIYDARDNEQLKARFMEALLGVRLEVVLLESHS